MNRSTQEKVHKKTISMFLQDYPIELIKAKLFDLFSLQHVVAYSDEVPLISAKFYEDLVDLLSNLRVAGEKPTTLVPSFAEHTLVSLEGTINLIKQAIPVGMIYNLSKVKEKLDLLIVLEKECTRAYAEFETIIDVIQLGFDGTCTIHNYGLLNAQIQHGHLFYTSACTPENLVYRKNNSESFTQTDELVIDLAKEKAAFLFNEGMNKAVNFYEGAQHYFKNGQYNLTIFMLHQACELTYRCLLNILRGKDLKCHSPAVLRKHVRRFAPEVIGTFSADENEELAYLQVLEDAYIKSRYEVGYTIEPTLIIFLNEKVGSLQNRAFELMKKLLS